MSELSALFQDTVSILMLLGSICLVLSSAWVSATEVAFFTLTNDDKQFYKEKNSALGRTILSLLDKPEKLLATILIANNSFNVSFIILATYLVPVSSPMGYIIEGGTLTLILLLFGEIIPKYYANYHPRNILKVTAFAIFFLFKFLSPISVVLVKSFNLIYRRVKAYRPQENIDMDDLSSALKLLPENDLKAEKELLEGILNIARVEVGDIAIARVDVVGIEFNDNYDKVRKVIANKKYSRIPVYENSFDNIKGILYIRDLIPHLKESSSFAWQDFLKKPYYVPANKKTHQLLEEFKHEKVHFAIVVDEYGGSVGIVTMEDILNEVMGNIGNYKEGDEKYKRVKTNEYIFEGKTSLKDFSKLLEIDDHFLDEVRGEADSIAGLILEMTGEFPKVGHKVHFRKLKFIIEEIDKFRIKRVKVVVSSSKSNQ